MKKKTIDKCLFLYLFHNIGPNLAQIFPQDHTYFGLFCWFPMKYVRGYLITNWNPVVLKKSAKTFQNYYFLAQPPQ